MNSTDINVLDFTRDRNHNGIWNSPKVITEHLVHYPHKGTLWLRPFIFSLGSIPLWPPCRLPRKIVFNRNNDHNEQFILSMASLYANFLLWVKWGFLDLVFSSGKVHHLVNSELSNQSIKRNNFISLRINALSPTYLHSYNFKCSFPFFILRCSL